MSLSPNDIRIHEFQSQMRGYDKDQVDNYLEEIATSLEGLKEQNLRLSVEADSLKNQLANLQKYEDTIKGAAIDARRNADELVSSAKKESTQMVEKAKSEVAHIFETQVEKVRDLESQIAKLDMARKSYKNKLQENIESHLDIIREIETIEAPIELHSEQPEPMPEFVDEPSHNDSDGIDVTDSSEVDNSQMETLANHSSGDDESETTEENGDGTDLSQTTVDPDLAAAIKGFRSTEDEFVAPEGDAQSGNDKDWVETDKRAEDIPDGFVSSDDNKLDGTFGIDTEKVANGDPKSDSFSPEKLATELDAVAAKFDEEMSKAEKN